MGFLAGLALWRTFGPVRVWAQAFLAMPAALSMTVRSMARRADGPLTLSVFTVNPNARRFYERLGFVVEGLKTIAFAGGDHEVWRMRKDRAAPL